MKKAGKLVTGLLGLAMAAVTVLPAMAAPAMVEKQVIHLEPNYLWTSVAMVSHKPTNQGALARCENVYPDDGSTDTLKHMYVRIAESVGTVISEEPEVMLRESYSTYTRVRIKEAYANVVSGIHFQFRSGGFKSAYAVVSYKGSW